MKTTTRRKPPKRRWPERPKDETARLLAERKGDWAQHTIRKEHTQ